MSRALFVSREEAGQRLAAKLNNGTDVSDSIVLALPRGGVPVGFEIAMKLSLPLNLFFVRKLSLPPNKELAIGAVVSGGLTVLNEDLIERYAISKSAIEQERLLEMAEIKRREQLFSKSRPDLAIGGKNVILVDDGLATGATMLAALRAVKQQASSVVVAVPIAAPSSLARVKQEADKVVCLSQPDPFIAVGDWYYDFPQLTDQDVQKILAKAWL